MITLDAIRTALAADDPYTRMDQLVRSEMAAGRKVDDIFSDLNPLVDTVLDTPELTEDGEEAFLGTLDALTGNCRSEDCYRDPPNDTLPTEDEIAKLPRWARVAFAARCARRVLPLFGYDWLDAKPDYLGNVSGVILAGERYSTRPAELDATDPSSDAFGIAILATIVGQIATEAVQRGHETAGYAAAAANIAAGVLAAEQDAGLGLHAVVNADKAATESGFSSAAMICRDFGHLNKHVEQQHWTDDTPVPPEVFGPLWPEGPPPGWPANQDLPHRVELPVSLVVREGTPPSDVTSAAVELFNAMNRYYIARTGDRLTPDGDIYTFLSTLMPAGVS